MTVQHYTGFHAVEERLRSLRAGEPLKVFYSRPGPRIKKILALAAASGVPAEQVTDAALDALVRGLPDGARDHRGIVLEAPRGADGSRPPVQLEQWLTRCPAQATVLVLDNVTDPHNVGAVLRSCDQFGAALLVLPERNSPSAVRESGTIARTSAGASAWVDVAVVQNLVRAVESLKAAGFWAYAAQADGASLADCAFAPRSCIVLGSEGSGISRLLSRTCDATVSIPTCGRLDSLNVSVAAGVLLYERARQQLSAGRT